MRGATTKIISLIVALTSATVVKAEVFPLDDALRATYTACVGIDDELADLKKMAGINTAVTGVGTAAGAGATVVGLVKASKDKQIANLEEKLARLKELTSRQTITAPNRAELLSETDQYYQDNKDETKTIEDEISVLTKQSKKLGNWRTGLVAGSTATNVAGAIIAGNNKVDDDLQTQIDNCKLAVKNLRDSIMQARFNGEDISEANTIADACKEYDYVDISPINKRAKGAMISSVIGATTGLAGTVTSAMANTDKIRDDNTDSGKQKEKNLNTAANVLSGATTVASATATVFNATQISAIKKVATVAQKCTEVLK
jgi:hypothetical protein